MHEQVKHLPSNAAVNPLLMPLLAAMEMGLNQLFSMDSETFARLGRFSGKIIAFHVTDFRQTVYFFPDHQGVQIISHYDGDADTTISGSLLAFARMAMGSEVEKTASVFRGDIIISGDIALGQHFQSLFKQLDIDWEEHLSAITGDVIAHSLGNLARGTLGWARQTLDRLGQDASEYVQYETRDVASGPEIEGFNAQIDNLRNDVDRAEARVNRLLNACQAISDKPVSDKPVSDKPVSDKPVSDKPVSDKHSVTSRNAEHKTDLNTSGPDEPGHKKVSP